MLRNQVWSVVVRIETAIPAIRMPTDTWRSRCDDSQLNIPEGMLKVGTCIRSTRRPDLPASG
jgi:hypothetical protein